MKGNYAFYVCLGCSIILFVGGFFVPPMGVVDGSVLMAGGILMGFASLSTVNKAIDKGKDATFSHGNINVSVKDNEDSQDKNGSEEDTSE